MFNNLEKIARVIYKEWKENAGGFAGREHPNEEALVCFLEDKLSRADKDSIQAHLLKCDKCTEYLCTQLKIEPRLSKDIPFSLLEKTRKIIGSDINDNIFEIFLKLKDKAWEIIHTGGDVLVGQELVPAPVLRSRHINEFKEEVSILKDLQGVRVLAKLESKSNKVFKLVVKAQDRQGKGINKNLRVTLIKDGVELESYVSDAGSSVFERVLPGDYRVEITQGAHLVAIIDLKVKA
jgi:hypothetical protein